MIIFSVIIYLLCGPLPGTGGAFNSDEVLIDRGGESSVVPKKWISEMMTDIEKNFDMNADMSDECRRDFSIYRLHAQNQTVWAIRMMESSEWPRIGLFSGVTTHLGHFSECLRSRGPAGIKGQYCVAQATYDFDISTASHLASEKWADWPQENASAWEVIKTHEKSPFRRSRRSLTWAMCIPSSCTAADLRTSLNNTMYPVFKTQRLGITVRVNPLLCKVEDASRSGKYHHTTMSYISNLIGILLLLMALSTIYELIFETPQVVERNSSWIKLIKSFSAVQNCKSLTQHSSSNTYLFIHFLKILLMSIIVWGHSLVIYYMFPKFETEEMETTFRPWSIELLLPITLNGFFMVTGFLRAFQFNWSPENEDAIKYFARSLVMKWLRMVPVSGLLILCFFFFLPYMEEGPLTSDIKLAELKYCSSNWWINMLAVQNFVNYQEMCHPPSWYIAADVQLFIMGTVLLMVLRKNRKYGIYIMILTFLYSALHTFVKIYSNGSSAFITEFFNLDLMNFEHSLSAIMVIHTMTFLRVGPYLVGQVTALITKQLMMKGFKFSRMQSILLVCCSFLIGFGLQLYGFLFYMVGRQNNSLEIAVLGVLQPILFVLPFASLICIHITTGFGILNSLVEQKIYIPFGKLSYCVYLVGFSVQSFHVFNQKRILSSFSRTDMYWWLIGDVFFILLFAFLFHLTCEGPVNGIINSFIAPYLVKKRKHTQQETLKSNSSNIQPHSNSSSTTKIKDSARARKTKQH